MAMRSRMRISQRNRMRISESGSRSPDQVYRNNNAKRGDLIQRDKICYKYNELPRLILSE
jgi:hypothetical protein